MIRNLAIRHLVLLAALVGPAAPTSALSTDALDLDAIDTPHGVAASPAASIWDRPAPAAPVVVTAVPAAAPEPQRALGANPLWAIPLASLSETRERPIFSPSRRPPPPATVASVDVVKGPPPKPAEPERPPLTLVGTIGSVDESFGIFVDQGTKAALRLKIGEDYQGWTLNEVHSREVTLLKDQRRVLLSLPQPGVGGEGRPQPPVTQVSVTSVEPARPEPARRLH